MTPEFAIQIIRDTLLMAFWTAAPILLAGFVSGIVLSLVQIVTSIQDMAFNTVPRLAIFLGTTIVAMPWMLKKSMTYAISILGDLTRYAR
jgi:flagellar biosynthetic protein FliQ